MARLIAGLGILAALLVVTGCLTVPYSSVRALPEPEGGTLFAELRVFDGEAVVGAKDVLIVDGAVAEVAPAGALAAGDGVEVVRCDDCTLLPGLIDLHVHLDVDGSAPWHLHLPQPLDHGRAYLHAGVTSVLVARGGPAERSVRRAGEREGSPAPHVYSSGPSLTAPGSHPIPLLQDTLPWPVSAIAVWLQPVATTPDEARVEVRRVARREAPPFFKIYYDGFPAGSAHMERPVMLAAVHEAIALGMRPVVHAGSAQDAVDAAEAGAALLMHAPFASPLSERQVERIAATPVAFMPTLRAFSWTVELMQGEVTAFERETVASELLEVFQRVPEGYEEDGMGLWMQDFGTITETLRANTAKLLDAGVPLLVGTDCGVSGVFPGAALHSELAMLVEMGLEPLEVLTAATSGNARFLDPTGGFGRIAPGQRADLLLVRGDPSEDIAAVDAIVGVWLEGVALERVGLDGQVVAGPGGTSP